MGRTLASFLVLAALGAAILAGRGLIDRIGAPNIPEVATTAGRGGTAEPMFQTADETTASSIGWEPVFGTAKEEVPVVRTAPPPPPPSFDYALKGVIVSGDIRWAILSGSGEDFIVQEGDSIDTARIAAINSRGIEVEIGGDRRTIAFSESAPVELAEIEVPDIEAAAARETSDSGLRRNSDEEDTAAGRNLQEVAFQGMTKEELRDILKRAEEKRRERGWIVPSAD